MTRNFHWFGAFAKLKRGVTLKQATAQMDAIGARIAQDYPDSNKGWGVTDRAVRGHGGGHAVASIAVRAAVRRRNGSADRLREPGQPDAGARHRPRARSGDPRLGRRRPMEAGAAVPDGERAAIDLRRRPRAGVGSCLEGRPGTGDAAVFPAARSRSLRSTHGYCCSRWRWRSSPGSFSDWRRRCKRRGRTWPAA